MVGVGRGEVFIHFMGMNIITIDIFYTVYTQSCVVCWMKAPNCLANIFIDAVNVTIHLGCRLFYSAVFLLFLLKKSSLSLTFLEIIKSYNMGKYLRYAHDVSEFFFKFNIKYFSVSKIYHPLDFCYAQIPNPWIFWHP